MPNWTPADRGKRSPYFEMGGREFHIGTYYEDLRAGGTVRITGYGIGVIVARRRGCAQFLIEPKELGKEIDPRAPIEMASPADAKDHWHKREAPHA